MLDTKRIEYSVNMSRYSTEYFRQIARSRPPFVGVSFEP